MEPSKPIVAIVGRPNVGKSTLFNRLVGGRRAITADTAGTTRDRLYGDGEWQGTALTLVDTGGLTERDEPHQDDAKLRQAVNQQVAEAVAEADILLLVTDVQEGSTAEDESVAALIRKAHKPVIVVANKADNRDLAGAVADFWELGLGEPQPVSSLHGRGTGDLADRILTQVSAPPVRPRQRPNHPVMAIVGRPNVGKSTLFNQLTDSASRITSHRPQTTRDIASRKVDTPAGPVEVLDTAGVPRRKHTGRGISKYSLLRTIRAIGQADVVTLLIDAVEGPTVQDAHITSYILESGKAVVVAVNKWDVVEKTPDIQETFYAQLQDTLGFLPSPPVVFVSAETGAKLDRLARAVYDVWQTSAIRVETAELNRFIEEIANRLPGGKRAPKLYYATQVDIRPPTFVLFVNRPSAWQEQHRRFITNALRERFGFLGATIRLHLRAKQPGKVRK